MRTQAVVLNGPRDLTLESVALIAPGAGDVVVDIDFSGISTGTEKLFWTGEMPPFPGMGYPLVPGYEATGEVVEADRASGYRPGDRVFVPGANCYDGAFGLFGGAAGRVVTGADRVVRVDPALGADGALLALAATARHAMAGLGHAMPELIVGHGVMGRLLARLTLAAGAPAPTVWDTAPERRTGALGYEVLAPEEDPRRDYHTIYDATGDPDVLDSLIGRLAHGGEVVLAGFYANDVHFKYPPAFMKEARLRIAAEWTRDDLTATASLVASGALSLGGLITHTAPANSAPDAYQTAFGEAACLKMVLNWKETA
ncbi:chlorophyll synthesis pathway protein BchC [Maritimibacter sp. UBA3975]|uniref:chlorophyll synthesis pathway protein BchC n=1 Tax=Maritimibacter sp. UBA3975 TaxID=1946833 RepID=UPI000C0A1F3C|nr:chlorophyll synthesis pathway protein BchC [Maritimibacter sp. UBA3975]MAM62929.1 chlorophyll synthesis pathway protein BchC [Maritimibacter sp.]|tara:strand:+ start:53391 stop:54332 length:942 start_codon:yes stop_codon:yes gene_type:complete